MFTISERAHNCESQKTSPVDENVEVFIRSCSYTMAPIYPSFAQKLCPCSNPRNTQNQLGVLAKVRRSGRMHGAHEVAEFIVGILHGDHDTYHAGLFLKTFG